MSAAAPSSDDGSAGARLRRWSERLFEPVDIASLVWFRIAFGAILLWNVWRYIGTPRIDHLLKLRYHFTYPGFGWVEPLPGDGLYWHLFALGVLAAAIAVGLLYRVTATLFFLGFTWFFLIDEGFYLNHYYLVCLVSLLMVFAPAHRALSLDAWLRPSLRSQTAPAWSVWMLRGQMGLVYFYAGVAKLNPDWLAGWPLREWLPTSQGHPLLDQAWFALFLSYGGLLLDLFAFPALLWRRTRPWAFAVIVGFHVSNALLFNIGIFPWLSIAMTLLFFEPDWPRRLLRSLGGLRALVPVHAQPAGRYAYRRPVVALLTLWFAVQVVVPLRHFLYPGYVSWTEEGHRFAWHMKLRGKTAAARFILHDPDTDQTWEAELQGLLDKRQFEKMASTPEMLHQMARFLAEQARQNGHERVEVRVVALASLNGYRPQLLVDPDVDLAAEPYPIGPAHWIRPFDRSVGRGSVDEWTQPPEIAGGPE